MSDKKIIIDGVDVAECNFYFEKDGSCMSHDCECTLCRHNDCYYKQLQQVKQENEELKNRLKVLDETEYTYQITEAEKQKFDKYKQLKEENEELKETIQELNDTIQTCNIERTMLYRKLEKIEECINTTCFDYAGIDMVYFRNELLQIIRGEE